MSDKQQNYVTLADLERQLIEHRAQFEKWKADNSRQKGTESYNDYVAKVGEWERSVKEKISTLQTERIVMSGPKNVDSILDELLEDASINDFLLAMASIHMKDSSFIKSFLSAFEKTQRSNVEAPPALVVPAAQFFPPPSFSTTNFTYTSPQLPHTSATAVPAMTMWSRAVQQVPPMHRPPSPIKDFQKKTSSIPFRDFSA